MSRRPIGIKISQLVEKGLRKPDIAPKRNATGRAVKYKSSALIGPRCSITNSPTDTNNAEKTKHAAHSVASTLRQLNWLGDIDALYQRF